MQLFFKTDRKQSSFTRFFKFIMNFFPVYRGTGGRIIFISSDWKEVYVRLRLNWRTRNYVGTIFGGSLYAAADPILMLQLIRILGKNYVVWDKSAAIRFRRPGVKPLQMSFLVTEELLERITTAVETSGEYEFTEQLDWVDKEGLVYAVVEKTIYVADKAHYNKKRANKISQKPG
jgi:acyl-coenzyme A thioesterase PaaI-like protein